ncbi:MAG: VWA domain-containing protein [Myxococcota bacterium]|nr:VWA domain-containing protein [Myxococcota bacterium]
MFHGTTGRRINGTTGRRIHGTTGRRTNGTTGGVRGTKDGPGPMPVPGSRYPGDSMRLPRFAPARCPAFARAGSGHVGSGHVSSGHFGLRRAGLVLMLGLAGFLASGIGEAHARPLVDEPAVARPTFQLGTERRGRGTSFFLAAETEAGAVAVAPAHNFRLAELVQTRQVDFVLGASGQRVGTSSRFHSLPGRPFNEPGSSVSEDLMLFALDLRPAGARVLQAAPVSGRALEGGRVRVLGVPANIPHDEDDIWGTVASTDDGRIEVELDVKVDLRGWGGAPVLRHPEGDVIGIVQAARPHRGRLHLRLTPITAVQAALARPLQGGLGQPFGELATLVAARAEVAGAADPPGPPTAPLPAPPATDSAATSGTTPTPAPVVEETVARTPSWDAGEARRDAEPAPPAPPPAPERAAAEPGNWTPPPAPPPRAESEAPRTWTPPPAPPKRTAQADPQGERGTWTPPPAPPTETAARPEDRAETDAGTWAPPPERSEAGAPSPPVVASVPLPRPEEGETLLGRAGSVSTNLRVEIEQPASGIVTGDVSGAFVAGRALASLGEFKKYDVMLVLDTSGSTAAMSGADINGNGIVGEGRLGNLMGGIFGGTDAGDSILAAEVAAAMRILKSLDSRNTRVGLVSFAGAPPPEPGFIIGSPRRPDAIVEEPLTNDFSRIEAALTHVLQRGPQGNTNMAEAVDRGYIELFGLGGAVSQTDRTSEKVILFFTDGQPTGPFDPSLRAANVEAVLRATNRARKLGVKIHSFGIGRDALQGPVAVVEMARRTGGYFTPVRHPGDLVAVIENVNLTQVSEITVENLSTSAPASELEHKADGSFAALVPLQTGNNRIRVKAIARDGSEAEAEVLVQYAPSEPGPEIPREFMAARNELLEQRLLALRRERMGVEREAVDQARKELLIDIQRERAEAEARADEQRKNLDLEALDDDASANWTAPRDDAQDAPRS